MHLRFGDSTYPTEEFNTSKTNAPVICLINKNNRLIQYLVRKTRHYRFKLT